MKKILFISIILIGIVILIVLAGVYVFFNPYIRLSPSTYITNKTINRTAVGEEQIDFVLHNIKAYKLHNVPLSSNTPKIELVIDDEVYTSEVVKGKLVTRKGEVEEEDIRISMSKEEFISLLNSENLKQDLQDLVEQGKIQVDVTAGNIELVAKGYLSLYEEMTGKSLIGI